MSTVNSNVTLDDIVFQERNKAYGAYQLRKTYTKYVTTAFIIGVLIFSLIFGGFALAEFVKGMANTEREVSINLEKIKPPPPKKLDIPPPPKKIEVIEKKKVATIKFVPPVPKKDEEVIKEEPPPDDFKEAKIATVTQEGDKNATPFETVPEFTPEEVKEVKLEKEEVDEIFTSVEQQAEFPGGISALYKYLGENIKYPAQASRANVSGKVFVKFVVEKDGSIGAVEVLRGIGFGCDEEAKRVVAGLPQFTPAKQNGRNVRYWFNLPVTFKLEE
ncbi:MAG: TonB family protein [Leadbetterella sp.]